MKLIAKRSVSNRNNNQKEQIVKTSSRDLVTLIGKKGTKQFAATERYFNPTRLHNPTFGIRNYS